MYFGLPANDVCSNVLLFIDNVEKLKVACCKKLTSRTMWKTQEVGIESFVCNDLRPSELYRASTIDHPNSTVHRPSTIRTLPCIDHRPSRFKKRASDIELPSSVLLWTSADGPKMEPRSKSWTSVFMMQKHARNRMICFTWPYDASIYLQVTKRMKKWIFLQILVCI